MQDDVSTRIRSTVSTNPVVLYMKGTKESPLCGFSKSVVHILNTLGVDFLDVDVLADPEIRQGIKDYTNWPTIPQLYINGEFVGGCDIVTDMYKSGSFATMLKNLNILL